jgi:hypothetical protein
MARIAREGRPVGSSAFDIVMVYPPRMVQVAWHRVTDGCEYNPPHPHNPRFLDRSAARDGSRARSQITELSAGFRKLARSVPTSPQRRTASRSGLP